ncbi:unnamed protein product [Rhizopus stolonifer]
MLQVEQEEYLKIKNNFWCSDKTALDTLLDRLNQTKLTLSAIHSFLQQRMQIEEDYGKRLLNLSQTILPDSDENPFDILLSTTETTARAHVELSQNINDMLKAPFDHYLKQQQILGHAIKDQIRNVHNVKTAYVNHSEKAYHAYTTTISQEPINQMDIDILNKEYEISVELLESSNWIQNWGRSCDSIQQSEKNRLDYIKSIILTLANMTSFTYSIDEEMSQKLSCKMDDLDTNECINTFVKEYGTGNIKPDRPEFIQYKEIEDENIPIAHMPIRIQLQSFDESIQNPIYKQKQNQSNTVFESYCNPKTKGHQAQESFARKKALLGIDQDHSIRKRSALLSVFNFFKNTRKKEKSRHILSSITQSP